MAYANLEPFGQSHNDRLLAMIAATVFNSAGKSAKKSLTVEDFVPHLKPYVETASVDVAKIHK